MMYLNRIKFRKNLVLFTLVIMNIVDQPAPEVAIEQGTLTGKISADGTVFEYIGIPYATANSSTRFKAPGPPPTWEGVYKAIEETHICPQSVFFGVVGDEDCLKINVYVPVMPKTKKPLAVMAYIHGGAFVIGSGSKLIYGPGFLTKKDVIFITFNYRMGALGFLCLRTKDVPGNAGLKDQIAALKWIKKNVAAFGGDPDNVTLFGESAGATSASLLLISEASKGLFNRVIIQSGSSVSNWAINRQPIGVASLLVKTLGYETEDPNELYKIFSKMSYKEITSLTAKKPLGLFYDTQLIHLPCVEYDIPGTQPIITDLPYNLFNKNPLDVDVIHGTASKEGLFLVAEETDTSLEEMNKRYLFASDLEFTSEEEAMSVAAKVHQFYFGENKISPKNEMNVTDLYSELYFEIPTIFETEYLLKRNNSKVYNYIFDHSGYRNLLKLRSRFRYEDSASHGDELFYIFNGNLLEPFRIVESDRKIIEYMTTMWTNFAKYGDPTPATSDVPIQWIPSSKERLNFLYIRDKLEMGPMIHPDGYQLWKYIYDKYRKTHIY